MGVLMSVMNIIENRRSIRKFKDEDVPKDMVDDILNAGRLAPSAKNKQPWSFVILSGERKDTVADIMLKDFETNTPTEQTGFNSSVCATAKVIKTAPILVLIFRKNDPTWLTGDNLSIGACVENMLLCAEELGLGTLWIRDTVYAAPMIATYVGKSGLELNCCVAIGYKDEEPPARPRKSLTELVEWQS